MLALRYIGATTICAMRIPWVIVKSTLAPRLISRSRQQARDNRCQSCPGHSPCVITMFQRQPRAWPEPAPRNPAVIAMLNPSGDQLLARPAAIARRGVLAFQIGAQVCALPLRRFRSVGRPSVRDQPPQPIATRFRAVTCNSLGDPFVRASAATCILGHSWPGLCPICR